MPGMVIEYSQTINRYTSKNALPFLNKQDLLDQASENTFFSKIDLTSAYHQIPLYCKDMPFTAFEINRRLFEFTRLPFGDINAVAAFQRAITAFVRRRNSNRTDPSLDGVIIRGRSEEEHQENLRAPRKTVPKLGHIVGAGSKRPDPS